MTFNHRIGFATIPTRRRSSMCLRNGIINSRVKERSRFYGYLINRNANSTAMSANTQIRDPVRSTELSFIFRIDGPTNYLRDKKISLANFLPFSFYRNPDRNDPVKSKSKFSEYFRSHRGGYRSRQAREKGDRVKKRRATRTFHPINRKQSERSVGSRVSADSPATRAHGSSAYNKRIDTVKGASKAIGGER